MLELLYPPETCPSDKPTTAACAQDEFRRSYRGDFAADHWERRYRGRAFLAEEQAKGTDFPVCRPAITLVLKRSKSKRVKSIKPKSAAPRSIKSRMQRVDDVGQRAVVIVQCDWRSSGYRSDWAREAGFSLSYRRESGNPFISFKVKLRKMIAPTATNGKTGLTLASNVSSAPHRPVAETINGTRANAGPAGAGSA